MVVDVTQVSNFLHTINVLINIFIIEKLQFQSTLLNLKNTHQQTSMPIS